MTPEQRIADWRDYKPFVENPALSAAISEWIKQGRSEEAIHGVLNFFTGRGDALLEEAKREELSGLAGAIERGILWDVQDIQKHLASRIEELKGDKAHE